MRTAEARRTESEHGQALILALGVLFVLMLGGSVLFLFGSALAGKGRAQRAADLAALSAARAMRDDLNRLFEPARIDGRRNPFHLSAARYLARGARHGRRDRPRQRRALSAAT